MLRSSFIALMALSATDQFRGESGLSGADAVLSYPLAASGAVDGPLLKVSQHGDGLVLPSEDTMAATSNGAAPTVDIVNTGGEEALKVRGRVDLMPGIPLASGPRVPYFEHQPNIDEFGYNAAPAVRLPVYYVRATAPSTTTATCNGDDKLLGAGCAMATGASTCFISQNHMTANSVTCGVVAPSGTCGARATAVCVKSY